MLPRPHHPSADLPLDNLTRRQAAVFEYAVGRTVSDLNAEIGMHELFGDPDRKPCASPSEREEHRRLAKECKGELRQFQALWDRLRRLRSTVSTRLSREEIDRLAAARAVREITSEEADLIVYGMLTIEAREFAEAAE